MAPMQGLLYHWEETYKPEILCPVMLLPIIRNFPECRLRMMYLPEIGLQGEALRL